LVHEDERAGPVGAQLVANIRTLPVLDWEIKGVGDFNGDNKPDILWRYKPTGLSAVWHIDLVQNPAAGWIGDTILWPSTNSAILLGSSTGAPVTSSQP
jgi:hypothetical protein